MDIRCLKAFDYEPEGVTRKGQVLKNVPESFANHLISLGLVEDYQESPKVEKPKPQKRKTKEEKEAYANTSSKRSRNRK